MLYGVPPACVYLSINLNCSDKSMKITSFNCSIEVSKDENGYSNYYYIDITDKGVSISHPYVTQTPEQVMFITKLVHDFIGAALGFNTRVDAFNRDNHLEQYAVVTPPVVETTGSDFDLDTSPAVAQSSHGVSKSESVAKVSEEAVKEKSLAKTIEDNVIESLGLK